MRRVQAAVGGFYSLLNIPGSLVLQTRKGRLGDTKLSEVTKQGNSRVRIQNSRSGVLALGIGKRTGGPPQNEWAEV